MFENAEWIALEDAHNAPWYGNEYGGEIEHLGRFELNTFVAEN